MSLFDKINPFRKRPTVPTQAEPNASELQWAATNVNLGKKIAFVLFGEGSDPTADIEVLDRLYTTLIRDHPPGLDVDANQAINITGHCLGQMLVDKHGFE